MEKYFVYILQSLSDCSFYTGYTKDIDKRLGEHNAGKCIYTSRKIPWKIVYTEEFTSKTNLL
jgi:putative endonuclease